MILNFLAIISHVAMQISEWDHFHILNNFFYQQQDLFLVKQRIYSSWNNKQTKEKLSKVSVGRIQTKRPMCDNKLSDSQNCVHALIHAFSLLQPTINDQSTILLLIHSVQQSIQFPKLKSSSSSWSFLYQKPWKMHWGASLMEQK